jgi:hypothetical protein
MTRIPSRSLLLALTLALAGCHVATPEATVREKLIAAGVKPHMAACLAPKLVRKLSIDQLKALGKLAKGASGDGHHLSMHVLEDKLQTIDDPRIVDVVSRAALACAILG